MAKQKQKKQEFDPFPIQEVLDKIKVKALGYSDAQMKQKSVLGIIIAVLLIGVSSALHYLDIIGTWIPSFLGAPAGIIIALLILCWSYRKNEDGLFSDFRESRTFKQRVRFVAVVMVVLIAIIIPLGQYIPFGIGGTIMILATLLAIVALYRTPYEKNLAVKGLPDPRDLQEEEERDEYAAKPVQTNPVPTVTQVSADTSQKKR